MKTASDDAREFTGRHMLAIMLAFFATIIGVNVVMAVFAGTSWTGIVVANSYVASQQFNGKIAESRAQAALGWTSALAIGDGTVRYSLADAQGRPVRAKGATVMFRRPAYEAEDETVSLQPDANGALVAEHVLRDGLWIADIEADTGRASPFREARRITVRGGDLK